MLLSLLASGGGSAITGFLFKFIGQMQELKASREKHQMEMLAQAQNAEVTRIDKEIELLKARGDYEVRMNRSDPHRSLARRILAYIIIVAFVMAGYFLVFFPEIEWFLIHEWTEKTSGFFGIGAQTIEHKDIVRTTGIPHEWLHYLAHITVMVVGFYFGGSQAKFKNPYMK